MAQWAQSQGGVGGRFWWQVVDVGWGCAWCGQQEECALQMGQRRVGCVVDSVKGVSESPESAVGNKLGSTGVCLILQKECTPEVFQGS